MDLKLFVTSLSIQEKNKLFRLLSDEIAKKNVDKLTTIQSFLHKSEIKISTRLRNVLNYNKEYLGYYIEAIEIDKLKNCPNIGKSTIQEFIMLRGY